MDRESLKNRGYQIIEQIGAGGFGVVYKALQTAVSREVAIKVILPEIARDPVFVWRFEQEAKLAARLEHPNIVPLYDYWQEADGAYLVMRWLPGGSLKELLEEGPLDGETAVLVVSQIASALEAAHELGVVHRDLKPSNVLLDEKGNTYLADFGIAKHLVGKTIGTPTGAIIGSPAYMAPEQITGDEVTARSDIYSLGVMIFEMVTGKSAFGDLDPVAMLYNQVNEPLPLASTLVPALPEDVDRVIQRATAKDPAERYADATDLSHAFRQALMPPTSRAEDKEKRPLHNLPGQSTPFIGRQDELIALQEHLADPQTRLLTIVGPGGMGKTRLALAAAESQIGRFEHGIFFVPLAPIDSPDDIPSVIGRALAFGFQGSTEPLQELADYLSRRSLLLVLDNFEHLLEGAPALSELMGAAPSLQILATSRERLRLQHEQLFPITGLSFPEWETPEDAAQYPAVQLFLDSARRVRPDFELGDEDLGPLTRICRLTQGMPLGILLAAGWVELLSPREIAGELEENLDILETDLQDIPQRQRSIRAVFDYTWDNLNRLERDFLQKMSVFRGSSSLQAVREVAGATLPILRSLANKSLLQVTSTDRYELHELLRQFTAGKLSRDPVLEKQVRDAHAAYYLSFVSDQDEALYSTEFGRIMAEMDQDLDNIRSAWSWAVQNRSLKLLEEALVRIFYFHSWRSDVHSLQVDSEMVVDRFSNSSEPRERLLAARALIDQGEFLPDDEDRSLLLRSLSLLQDETLQDLDTREAQARCLARLGMVANNTDTEEASAFYQESLALYREIGDTQGMTHILLMNANNQLLRGSLDEAQHLAEEYLALAKESGHPGNIASGQVEMASVNALKGEYEQSIAFIRRHEEELMALGDPDLGLARTGLIRYWIGLSKEAYDLYDRLEETYHESGAVANVTSARLMKIHAGVQIGKYRQALQEAGELTFTSRFFAGRMDMETAAAHLALGEIDAALGDAEAALDMLEAGGFRQLVPVARSIYAMALRSGGDDEAARNQLVEALALSIEIHSPYVASYGLAAAALLLADMGREEEAVGVYELTLQIRFASNSEWFHDVAGKEIQEIASSLTPAKGEAARLRGAELDLWETAGKLLAEFNLESPDT